jgi:hypothetical protein
MHFVRGAEASQRSLRPTRVPPSDGSDCSRGSTTGASTYSMPFSRAGATSKANRQTWRTSVSVFRERPGFQMQFDWTWPDVILVSEAVHYSGGALHNDDLVVPIASATHNGSWDEAGERCWWKTPKPQAILPPNATTAMLRDSPLSGSEVDAMEHDVEEKIDYERRSVGLRLLTG